MLIASSHLPAKEAGPGILVMMDLHMWTLMMDSANQSSPYLCCCLRSVPKECETAATITGAAPKRWS